MEEQQYKKETQKHVDKCTAVCNETKQQHEEVRKSIGAVRGQRIKSAKSVKLQKVRSACDVLE